METIKLNDGNTIPVIGFGVYMIPNDGSTYKAVLNALKAGYRHIDTAAAYFNEEEVGRAIKDSGIKREEIFVTDKLWLQDYGYAEARMGLMRSLHNLGLDYVDLYLLHQPYGDVVNAWRALEDLKAEGYIRSIGVSNMTPNIWEEFVPQFKTLPAVNQVEYNPTFLQKPLRNILDPLGVYLEAWYPLGHGNKELLNHPLLAEMAAKYKKTIAQIILRFELQMGVIVLPKANELKHMKDNIAIFDFKLDAEDMHKIASLDTGKGSHDPETKGMGESLLANFKIHD